MNAAIDAVDLNSHVASFLRYYVSFRHPPRYAVLITGAWGVGKTFHVKKFLSEYFGQNASEERRAHRTWRTKPPEPNYVYISLFGVSSVDELDATLLAALIPWIGDRDDVDLTARAVRAGLKNRHIDFDVKAKDFAKRIKRKLYVFDDLERSEMDLGQILGYINQFVEHDGCKVIVIANTNTMDQEKLKERREKLIGKTLEVFPSFSSAFDSFLKGVDSPFAQSFLRDKHQHVEEIFNESQLNNHRILQQTMWEFARVCDALTDIHRNNRDALLAILKLIFCLSFEFKSGRIGQEELEKRAEGYGSGFGLSSSETEKFSSARNRYKSARVDDSTLPNSVLVDIFVRGLVDSTAIQVALNQTPYFLAPEDEPAWRTLWHSVERPRDQVDAALAKLTEQFQKREITENGEIMHMAGLLIWLGRIGQIEMSPADVVTATKVYIDDLKRDGKLGEPPPVEPFATEAHAGLMVYERESPEYREVINHLRAACEEAKESRYPVNAEMLLDEMRSDPMLFMRRISYTGSEENVFAGTPVLAAIEPARFVDEVMKLSESDQRTVTRALNNRYSRGGLRHDLAPEASWIKQVRLEFENYAASKDPITRWRIKILLANVNADIG